MRLASLLLFGLVLGCGGNDSPTVPDDPAAAGKKAGEEFRKAFDDARSAGLAPFLREVLRLDRERTSDEQAKAVDAIIEPQNFFQKRGKASGP